MSFGSIDSILKPPAIAEPVEKSRSVEFSPLFEDRGSPEGASLPDSIHNGDKLASESKLGATIEQLLLSKSLPTFPTDMEQQEIMQVDRVTLFVIRGRG